MAIQPSYDGGLTTRDCENPRENAKSSITVLKSCSKYHGSSSPFPFQRSAFILLLSCALLQSLMTGAFSPKQMPPRLLHHHRKVSFRHPTFLFYRWTGTDARSGGKVDIYLRDRNVRFESKACKQSKPLPSFKEVWELLRKVLPNGGDLLPTAESALKTLASIMNEECSSELAFDEALFEAINGLLTPYAIAQNDPNSIILNLGSQTQHYAVGIARQKSPSEYLPQDEMTKNKAGQGLHASSERDTDASIPDHTACLFHNDTNIWSATDCFSVVELRTSSSTCESFDFNKYGDMLPPDLFKRHLALGQVTLFNLWFVLLCQAKRGVLAEQIPLAIVAGKMKQLDQNLQQGEEERTQKQVPKKAQKEMVEKLRWISGTLHVPRAFGDAFCYSVEEFENFSDDDSAEQALSLYVNTLLSGLVAAIKVQNELAAGEVPVAVTASGQSLMIGDTTLNLQLCASSIPSAVASQDSTTNEGWKISQCDLFRGRLDVSEVLPIADRGILDFRRGKNKRAGASDILVKVSSTTVHHLLIDPIVTRLALQRINLKARNGQADKGMVNAIGSVLYAVVPTGPNLMTIMKDLTKQGYGPLKAIDNLDRLEILWGGFQDLVVKVLLPMARLGIIHADLRPGMDETSNILCKIEKGKSKVAKATMKLIDFESLVDYDSWNPAYYADGQYIPKQEGWDATTYVWWQSMAVAYAWKESLNANSLARDLALHSMKRFLLIGDLDGPAWLSKYRDRAKSKITPEIVKQTLLDLAGEFSMKPSQGSAQLVLSK